jgi:hypothetical protein
MRRDSLKLKLTRIALAYAIALQALLGVFAGPGAAAGSFDPALSLCRTAAGGEAQPSDDHSGPATHCAAMCLSGACAAGEPPLAASASVEFPQPPAVFVSILAVDDRFALASPGSGLNARGPPSIG